LKAIAFDTETGGLDWFEPDQRTFLTTWSDEHGDYLAHQDDAQAMGRFREAVEQADVCYAHNLPFDVHQVRVSDNGFDLMQVAKRLVDTATVARVVLSERGVNGQGFKLKDLATDLVDPNAKDSEDALKAVARKHGFPLRAKHGYLKAWQCEPEIVEEYAKNDTRLTFDLVPPLRALVTEKLRPTLDLELSLQPHLIRAEARGVRVDPEKVEAIRPQWLAKRDAAYARVVKVLGPDAIADPDDPDDKDNHEVLAAKLQAHGVPLHRTTDSGGLATNKGALQEFIADWPVLADLFEYRTAAKFVKTYIDPLHGRDVVHPSIWQMGAWTGRMSMSRPNMQNIPVRGEGSSELREMFIPREDHVFVVTDFDQIELRLLAYYLNDPVFQQKIEAGWDAFAHLAADINRRLNYAPELGTDPANFGKGTPGALWRGVFKNVTYAITYGAGGGKIHDMIPGLDIGPPLEADAWVVKKGFQKEGDPSYAPAREIISMVKSWLPGYDDLMQRGSRYRRAGRFIEKVERDGFISTINGRKQCVSPDKSYIAGNAVIQGGAADIFKTAVILVAERTKHLGSMPLLFVHDEIGSECPTEYADEVLQIQDQAMREAWDLTPKLAVSSAIARGSYADAK
jgi:DNA polymerase-1